MASSTASLRSSGIRAPPVPFDRLCVSRVRGRWFSSHGALALRFVECQVYDARMNNRYGADVLSGDWHVPRNGRARQIEAESGLVVEDVETGWWGAVSRVEKAGGMQVVHLEDRHGRSRGFPLGPGFLLDGAPVILTRPAAAAHAAAAQARDAMSRTAVIAGFQPGPGRRLGVLVDHLVPGTKENTLVAQARALRRYAQYVTILGHPYVDVWQSVRPERLGLQSWPVIPRGQSWKHGIVAALGWPHESQTDIANAWARILATVRTYADLEPALLASVEELIDFVTAQD